MHRGVAFCSNFDDQRLYRVDPGAGPVPITPARRRTTRTATRTAVSRPTGRSGSGFASVTRRATSSCGRRQRARRRPDRRLLRAARHRERPRLLLEPAHLARRQAALLPRVESSLDAVGRLRALRRAISAPDGELTGRRARRRARTASSRSGSRNGARAGDLVFASDRSGWWNLERIRDGERVVAPCRGGRVRLPGVDRSARARSHSSVTGASSARTTATASRRFGVARSRVGRARELDLGLDCLAGSPYVVGRGLARCARRRLADDPEPRRAPRRRPGRRRGAANEPRTARSIPACLSMPRADRVPDRRRADARTRSSTRRRTPTSRRRTASCRRCIVMSHGGPTGSATADRSTSDAVLDEPRLRDRRRELRRLDRVRPRVPGAPERPVGRRRPPGLRERCAATSSTQGEADPDRLLITGGSAGGYTTICALTFTDVFAAGATYFGIADLEQFGGGETHKFELQYEHTLVGPYPETADVYRERSPIHFTDRITTPMLVLQGDGRPDRAAVAGGAHRRRAARARDPARVPPLRGRRARLPEGREHRRRRSRPSSRSTRRCSASSRPATSRGSRSSNLARRA